ncbi:hypothetical protein BFP72_17850 [Reichenbachiella sp. 5M10]|uniref:polysialyltransferase family glycosyltransferase n=1 Tax=Reichenbachiella sp. 5M10 TaxID=1889772 RepID=UPI000C14CEA9|nr:polysialyltransferase family glycosyltransferase [Reichenbachiella sp. 5M10]PIB37136.1 hypothetical protein BFP72_17850 [Reichenbachiella sp. 5M10]
MILAVIGSPWQALVLKVYLSISNREEDDAYVIFEKTNDSSLNASLEVLGNQLHPDLIFDFKDFRPVDVIFGRGRIKIHHLLSNLDLAMVDTLLVASEKNELAYFLNLHLSRSVKRVKLDDGILDYLPKLGIDKKWTYKLRLLLGYGIWYRRPTNFNELCMVFPEYYKSILNESNAKCINLRDYRELIIRFLKNEKAEIFAGKKVSLVVGQALSEDSIVSLNEEVNLYEEIFKEKHQKHGELYFKPHPRSSDCKIKKVEKLASEYGVQIIRTKFSLESIFANNNVEKAFGLYSNAIIYSLAIFDIKSHVLLDILLKNSTSRRSFSKAVYIKDFIERLRLFYRDVFDKRK